MFETLPPVLQQAVQSQLTSSEQVRWWTQPDASSMKREAYPFVVFGIPITLIALLFVGSIFGHWENGEAIAAGPGIVLPIVFGLPFLAIGLLCVAMPYFAWKSAQYTIYIVTDQRALNIYADNKKTRIKAYEPKQLRDLIRKKKKNGGGDIKFIARYKRLPPTQAFGSNTHDIEANRRADELEEEDQREEIIDNTSDGFTSLPDVVAAEKALKELIAHTEA